MSEVGLIGLGVMGENLALNIASKGYQVTVYNRTQERTRFFIENVGQKAGIKAAYSIVDFTRSLERPRKIILMVKAGQPVDAVLADLTPHLTEGDMIFDCGNSHYSDTERRQKLCSSQGLTFMGVGVSGGEEGALKGPAIMLGGPHEGYMTTREFWEAIAAKAEGEPCAGHMGLHGAGHFVKMVHNGIEYGLLQLIAETYDIMVNLLGLDISGVADVFRKWVGGELGSYLLEIAVDVLSVVDGETGKPLVEHVLDRAEHKGTGKWSVQTAAELGVATPSIDAALSARYLSAMKDQRIKFEETYGPQPSYRTHIPTDRMLDMLEDAYWCTAVACYAQGLDLIRAASVQYGYGTDLRSVLKVWRAGCIIRARLIQDLIEAVGEGENILLSSMMVSEFRRRWSSWAEVLSMVGKAGVPTPVMDASYNYLKSLRRSRLPANIIQALRDRFGAHTFERIDRPGRFHHSWRP